ncbi:UPF0182 family protein [uncultured Clostridium sp.]|uniref:UPF0182 family protein n=1 Tax=uncultured Clostridium sp. TaxID=59620 RepID=UPI0028EE9BDB|nr:UPF0182 family protein [uncultured Clostridium sp.]
MKKSVLFIIFISIITLSILFINTIVQFLINIQWYKDVVYLSVYFNKINALIKLMIPSFIIVFIFIYVYYSVITKKKVEFKKIFNNKILLCINSLISISVAYLFSSEYWYYILQFNNSVNFNLKDPIFNKDIAFYIFKLPLIESIYNALMGLLLFLILTTSVIYFVLSIKDRVQHGGLREILYNLKEGKSRITILAGRQLAVISSLILIILSLGFFIKSWNLVYSPRGGVFGASYTDVKVTLLFYRIIILLCIISAIVVFFSIIRKKIKPIIICLGCIFVFIIIEGVTSNLVQNSIVKSNEKKLEEPYIKYNIAYTRKAFGIDDIQETDFSVENNLTINDINNNKDIIDNIRINAFEPALEFYNQYQTIRPYYVFNDMDIDRYKINDKYTQVFIAPRELNLENIDPNTWQNKHLIYTHGYGVAMSKVNSVTKEGQPNFLIKDIPEENTTDIALKNSRIYFGEKTNDYAIVNTNLKEFDYPKGGDNKINQYDGKSGIRMTLFNKVLFAIKEKNLNFILSRDITRNSKILINRNIIERVNKIAPFLIYDQDPYVVIHDEKLYWIVDAYTVSNRYPYSQPYNNVNYIRNSVKVVIDASEGDVDFYIVDKNDPIIMSYSKIFKNLFKDLSSMPQGLKDHIKYPEDIFKIQCNVLEKYHMTDPIAFLNGDDLWEVSKNEKLVQTKESVDESPYVVMRLPGEKDNEMVVLEYFNMKDRNNMSSIFGARMDGDNYGKLIMYRMPSHKTIYNPYFFNQKLKQDPSISKEIALWSTNVSEVIFGDTIIVPLNNSLLYVESMYLRASGKNSAPEVKRIILSYADRVVLAENLDLAIKQMFNVNEEENNNEINKDLQDIKSAKDVYEKAIEAQKNGDWAKYGEYIKSLGEILNTLNKE